jgi:hypothetical protein
LRRCLPDKRGKGVRASRVEPLGSPRVSGAGALGVGFLGRRSCVGFRFGAE